MDTAFPDYVAVDYEDGAGGSPADYPTLAEKLAKATEIVALALDTYRRPAVLWTGGKDSTLVLHVVREVARERGVPVPPIVFIDHFEHFPETVAFVERWADAWGLDLRVARNGAIDGLGVAPGDRVPVAELDESTRRELARLGHDDGTLVVDADTFEGNHLLKTVAFNDLLAAEGFDAALSGVRWDEQAARGTETFFSPRHDAAKYPPHDRVHPILGFTEADVWDATWRFVVPDAVPGYPEGRVPESADDLPDGVDPRDLPVSPTYFEGFRSVGTASGSGTAADRPAWLQDLDGTPERAGRAQDKEDLMERLRDLGYM